MRFRVHTRPALRIVLVLVIVISFTYYVFRGYLRIPALNCFRASRIASADAQASTDPQALLTLADHFYWLNNGTEAAPLYSKAERLFSQRGDRRNELYARVGRLRSEAEMTPFVELSRALNEELQNPIVESDSRLRVWCLMAKGYTDIEFDYRAAKQDWLEAEKIAKGLDENQLVARARGELGLIAFLEGTPGRAARLLGEALLSTMATGDTGGQIRFLELLGTGFGEVNRHAEALRFFERAIKLAEGNKDSGIPYMAYEGKAQSLTALGKADEAKKVIEDALGKAKLRQKRSHEVQLQILLGELAAQTGDKRLAVDLLEGADKFAREAQFYRMEADAMFELAKLYRDFGDLDTADARATQGLAASQRAGDRYYMPRNFTILADLKFRRGHVSEANALYEQAEDVIEGMLISADQPYWNSSVAASMSQTYLQHFELVSKTGDVPAAFRVLERVRGRTLAWALADRKGFRTPESSETAALESDISGFQVQLMQAKSESKREQLLNQLLEYERRLSLTWINEDVVNRRLPAQPIPLGQLRNDLKPDEVFLEYVLDDPNSFCLSLSRKSAYLRLLPAGRKEIEQLTQKFRDEVRARSATTDLSKQLYRLLVTPMPEIDSATRLIIAPDGMLNLLPFESLRDDHDQYLLKSHVVSYAPSGTILDVLRHAKKQPPAPNPFLGVGDVAYESQPRAWRRIPAPDTIRGRVVRGIADLFGMRLHDLPQTREELEEIGRIVGPDSVILLGDRATETAFKSEPLDRFRILHLAVHGFADTEFPERSALILGTDSKSEDDGLLQVREITRLRLNAQLTTLSACDTGIGKLEGQEGISNLVQAFLVAGSKSVVASLWSTEDTFTRVLMNHFYRRLSQGEDGSSALRNAKLDLLAKYGNQVSPFYWAAFITVGDASTPLRIR
jgi:CHAT domain-containing protein/tetratricopeptide (TPR) repeat protein